MKKFTCAFIALIILSFFCVPLSAAEECGHLAEGIPVGVDRFFETVDNDTHAICYICEDCGETVTVSVEEHSVAESDGKCAYCGYKVCLHEFVDTYYSRNDAETHIKGVACKACYDVTEIQEPHEYTGGICVGCGLQAPAAAPEDPVPPVDGGEEEPPVGEENEPPTEDPTEDYEFIISQFFEEKILPLAISAGAALLLLIAALTPIIKFIGKLKKKIEDFRVLCASLKTSNSDKDKIIAKINPDSFENKLNKKISELNTVRTELIDVKARMEQLIAQFELLKKGAMNAWAQSPAAVAALTASPNDMVIAELTSKVSSFENYIREQKGEEAERIIAELKGESHDEQGNVPAV